MFKKLIDSYAGYKADKDVKYGLGVVQDSWVAYKAKNQRAPQQDIIEYVAPFIAPMMAQLNSDRRCNQMPYPSKLGMVFIVLIAHADTEDERDTLRAMHEHLVEGK